MIRRIYEHELEEIGEFSPVIGVLGPRQVGKTTLVRSFSTSISKDTIYLDLEKPSDVHKLKEPELYFTENQSSCIIIDEIQVMPELFGIIRSMVDEYSVPLRFIILGSASPDILRDASESLAGRISYIDLKPFSISEIPDIPLSRHHFQGGFPKSVLGKEKQSLRWRDDFIRTYVERDLPLLGLPSSPQMTRRLWEMLAWQTGGLFNATSIGKSLGLSNHTINKYVDFLEGTFMINRLQPFSYNAKKRIVKSPKIYVSDTGVLHGLLRVNSYDQLLGHPNLGASWETFVLQQIITEKPESLDIYYYRTHAGTEVDIVLSKSLQPIAGLEVKFTATPKVSKALVNGTEDLDTSRNYIITPKEDDFPLKQNIRAIGIRSFIREVLPTLA